ncbi:hypothetical protein BOW34_00970 [Solemya velum gill symbiont]|nr:hypothetical protein BOW27_00960 [Solemya velum gill symbiont]OOZ23255.1 hypothetical protein BOW30_03735 [Solemya velum gill symbiont]OOZ24178.1 hypothetical protein BOW31_08460 [Solemya velum gill symbiont]OOZ26962.1 hypothetical protein BOW33_12190 [Solemya velum gill symbiont]OOZ33452.1 hypothetical protein BOW34_00970 [Solemya velum gill symbiont]
MGLASLLFLDHKAAAGMMNNASLGRADADERCYQVAIILFPVAYQRFKLAGLIVNIIVGKDNEFCLHHVEADITGLLGSDEVIGSDPLKWALLLQFLELFTDTLR